MDSSETPPPAPAEAYGFVIYCLSIHVGILYILLALLPSDITSFHHGSLLVAIPTICLAFFVVLPFIYALLNYLSSPRLTSRDNLQDEYSLHHPWLFKKSNDCADNGNDHSTRRQGLDFCDFDVSCINVLMSRKVD